MKPILAVALLLLSGCGNVDWFPPPAPVPASTVSSTTTEPVGAFVSSARNATTREWFTTTTSGVFRMYTSTPFIPKETIALETITGSGATIMRRTLIGQRDKFDVKL